MQLFKIKRTSVGDSDERLGKRVWFGYSDVEMLPVGHIVIIYYYDEDGWFVTSPVKSVNYDGIGNVLLITDDITYILEEIKDEYKEIQRFEDERF